MTIPEAPPPVPPPRQQANGCLIAFLIVLGIVLLLPGLCSLAVLTSMGESSMRASSDAILWVLAFAITLGGIALIVLGVRNSLRR
jgi:hypothetical protein